MEILIADDGSTDGSRDLIQRYAAKDSRIRCGVALDEVTGSGTVVGDEDHVREVLQEDGVAEKYLAECLTPSSRRTSDMEILIADDGSTDGSRDHIAGCVKCVVSMSGKSRRASRKYWRRHSPLG